MGLHGKLSLLDAVITNLRIIVPTGDDEDDASALPLPLPHPLALAVEKPDALLPSKHLTVVSTSSAPSSSSSGIVLCVLLSSHLCLFDLFILQCQQ